MTCAFVFGTVEPRHMRAPWDSVPQALVNPLGQCPTDTGRPHGMAPHGRRKPRGMAPHQRVGRTVGQRPTKIQSPLGWRPTDAGKPRGMAPHHPLKGLLGWPPTSAGRSPVPQCEPNEPDMPANGICLRLPACLRLWSPLHIGVVRILSTRRIPRTKIARNRPFSRRINWAIINFALQNRR